MTMMDDQTAAEMIGTRVTDVSLKVLRTSPDCIKLLNRDGRISFMSENGMCAMEIDNPADVGGKTWWELWPENDQAPLRRAFERSLEGQVTMYQGRCPTGKGVMKDWDVRITPLIDEDGTVTSVLAISRDVTPPS